MKLIHALLLLPLLSGCAATLTLRNDRPGPVKNVLVRAAGTEYSVSELASGAQHVQSLKVKAGGDLAVNYVDEDGRTQYTSSKMPLLKGDSRKWLLILDKKTLLSTEIQK